MKIDHTGHYILLVENAMVSREIHGLDEDGIPVTGPVENIKYLGYPMLWCDTCDIWINGADIGARENWKRFV